MKRLFLCMVMIFVAINAQAGVTEYARKINASRIVSGVKSSAFGYATHTFLELCKEKVQNGYNDYIHAYENKPYHDKYTNKAKWLIGDIASTVALGYFSYLCLRQSVRYAAHALDVDCS